MVSAVAASNAYSGVAQTRAVIAAPTVQPVSSAPSTGVTVSVSPMARAVAASAMAPSTIMSALISFQLAQNAGTLSSFGAVTIADTSDALTGSALTALATMEHAGKIAGITFTNPSPTVSFSRNDLTGNLSSSQNTNDKVLVLQTISSPYTLNLTDISVSDVSTIQAPTSKSKLTFNVTDTAANISANIDQLEKLAETKVLKGITVSDISNPISISNASIKKDAAAIKLIGGNYQLAATGVLAGDLSTVLKNSKVTAIKVEDTMANILKYKDTLSTAATAGKLTDITYTDTKTANINIANGVFLMTLGASVTSKNNVGYSVSDNTSTVIAHARYDIGDVLKHAVSVSATDSVSRNISLADAVTLNSLTNLAAKTKYNVADKGSVIAAQAKTSNETILSNATNVQLVKSFSVSDAAAVTGIKALDKGTKYSITDTAANILSQSAVRGDTILSKATTVNIVDTSANIFANLDQIEVLAKAGKIADITFTDNPTAAVQLSSNQVNTDAEAIGKITNQFYLMTAVVQDVQFQAANYDGSVIVGTTGNNDQAIKYQNGHIYRFGTLWGSNGAYGVNSSGSVIVGAGAVSDNDAFKYENGTLTDLGNLGDPNNLTYAYGVSNDGGTIVGQSNTTSGYDHAFIYKNGTMTDITPTSRNSWASGVSADGTIVSGGGDTGAFIYKNGTMTNLGSLIDGGGAYINSLSADGSEGVGWSDADNGFEHAIIYKNGSVTDIDNNPNSQSFGEGISGDSKIIVGTTENINSTATDLFVYQNGAMQDFGNFNFNVSYVNISGDGKTIVGTGVDNNTYNVSSFIIKSV